ADEASPVVPGLEKDQQKTSSAERYFLAAIRRSQWLTSVDFPTPAQATMVTTLTSFFAHARSRKVISSSRPKISLPVMGNLANEIFFGVRLARGLRVPTREAEEGVFWRL